MKKISILGSTGSIGRQTLDVVRQVGCAEVVGLCAGENIDLLEKQIIEFSPIVVSVMKENKALELQRRLKFLGIKTEVLSGLEGNISVATLSDTEIVLNAVVGSAGLIPTDKAIKAKKNIALANKETLVAAGEIIMKSAKENNVSIIPVDSEHSAIFQCLETSNGCNKDSNKNSYNYEKIYLTASGGPFRGKTASELEHVTASDALKHPNWIMGKKITIDSATLMNKGLEFIEAKWLFDAKSEQIEVIIHPESIIHSMVEFSDGVIIAQLGSPDMRLPIQYALTYPERIKNDFDRVNFFQQNTLTFEKPNYSNFPCLKMAMDAIKEGGAFPAVMSAANEIAVEKFLNGKISFVQIPKLIELTMSAYTLSVQYPHKNDLSYFLEAEDFARAYATNLLFV